jgi:hypothetical protein
VNSRAAPAGPREMISMRRGHDRLSRRLRGWRLDRNPLRRGSDRAETIVLGALLALFLVAVPLAGQAAGSWAHGTFGRETRAQRAVVQPVRATLLRAPVPVLSYPGAGAGLPDGSLGDARWRGPDGRVRTGWVLVPAGAAAGSRVPVWVDRAGRPAGPPLSRAQLAGRVQLARGLAVGALAVAWAGATWLTRRVLDRRRMAAWAADWWATAPRWSPRA